MMKRCTLYMILFLLFQHAIGQNLNGLKVTMNLTDKSLKTVFGNLATLTGTKLIYNDDAITKYDSISINVKEKSFKAVLEDILSSTNLHFLEQNGKVVIESTGEQNLQEMFSISGSVQDEKGQPVPGATVFLSNSKWVVIGNESGKFTISKIPGGIYDIVVKMLGFQPFTQSVLLDKSTNIKVTLKEESISLSTVNIIGKGDPKRAQYLAEFTKQFLGTSPNASKCTILNPEVIRIRFDEKENEIIASSSEFLFFENRALGYRVGYALDRFEMNFKKEIFEYEGFPYFEELEGTDEEKAQWHIARNQAYNGSVSHFFKSAFNNKAEEEGFLIYRLPEREAQNKMTKTELSLIKPIPSSQLFSKADATFKMIDLSPYSIEKNTGEPSAGNNGLYIVYTKEKEAASFLSSGQRLNFPLKLPFAENQISFLTPVSDVIIVDKNGRLTPPKSFFYYGYWGFERAADMMPINFLQAKN